MTYYGYWNTNNGNTHCASAYVSKNKRELAKTLKRIAMGNIIGPRDVGRWSIWVYDEEVGCYAQIMIGEVRW